MVRPHTARGGDGMGILLLQLGVSLLQLHILFSEEFKVLLWFAAGVPSAARRRLRTWGSDNSQTVLDTYPPSSTADITTSTNKSQS